LFWLREEEKRLKKPIEAGESLYVVTTRLDVSRQQSKTMCI